MRDELTALLREVRVDSQGLQLSALYPKLHALMERVVAVKGRWLDMGEIPAVVLMPVIVAIGDVRPAEGRVVDLNELLGRERSATVEQEIATLLDSFPREYHFYFKIARAQDIASEDVQITPNVHLLSVEVVDHFAHLAIPHGRTIGELLSGDNTNTLQKGSTYVRITGRGYFSGQHDSSACVDALTSLKQLVELGVASGRLVRDDRPRAEDLTSTIAVVRDVSKNVAQSVELPSPIVRTLQSIAFDGRIFLVPQGFMSFGGLGGVGADARPAVVRPREEIPAQVAQSLKRVGDVIARNANDPDTQAIRTAAEWAFDSWAEDNQTLAFLFASIGLEAVLQGDNNETADTSARMADRLAYLLGKTRKQRSNLQDGFRKFYKVRGNLVHGRTSRLKQDERRWLDWGKEALRDVIARELANVQVADE